MGRLAFLKESLKNLKDVGTVTRSSRYISRAMIKAADLSGAKVIVELGAGDGVVTKHILQNMDGDALLFSFEINAKFCQIISRIKDERLRVVNISADKVESVLQKYGHPKVDVVFSELPFTNFPLELVKEVVTQCESMLKEGGRFVQIHYSLKMKKLYYSIFHNIKMFFELRNLPPAFILLCIKGKKD